MAECETATKRSKTKSFAPTLPKIKALKNSGRLRNTAGGAGKLQSNCKNGAINSTASGQIADC